MRFESGSEIKIGFTQLEQGGTYAGTRINVGELSTPINGSNFIRDTELSNKLMKQFVF